MLGKYKSICNETKKPSQALRLSFLFHLNKYITPLTCTGKCEQSAASLKEYCHYQGMKIAFFLSNSHIFYFYFKQTAGLTTHPQLKRLYHFCWKASLGIT